MYSVITAEVLYSEKINDSQKILMAIISNLANEKGYCFALNPYLAKLRGKSERSINRDIAALTEAGFLGRADWVEKDGKLITRALTPLRGLDKNGLPGLAKNVQHNNTTLSEDKDSTTGKQSSLTPPRTDQQDETGGRPLKTDLTVREIRMFQTLGTELYNQTTMGNEFRKRYDVDNLAELRQVMGDFKFWLIAGNKSFDNPGYLRNLFRFYCKDKLKYKSQYPHKQ